MLPRDKFLLEIVFYYLQNESRSKFQRFTTLANDEEN
jgi:hypothetical protein